MNRSKITLKVITTMNFGILSTVAAFVVMNIIDPEGTLDVETQIALGGVVFTLVTWAKSKITETKKEEDTKASSKVSSPSIG